MKKVFQFLVIIISSSVFAQAGHIMQGVGAVNMSMGGAATAMPIDINGTIHWNPAALSEFEGNHLAFDLGIFFSSPELSSTVPTPQGPFSGVTKDDRGASPMPALGYFWGKADSKHKFAVSAFGISGFGVTFPENMNNPINMPQNLGGFGHIESDYMLLQIGFSWSYELTENISFGLQPTFNWASLELAPNPLASPSMAGYPVSDKATSLGYGAQIGLFYHGNSGFNVGLSYKTPQFFEEFKFENTYLDNTTSENSFEMDYPQIFSAGVGYQHEKFDLALDYRFVNYSETQGFKKSGWTQMGAVQGFGWDDMNMVSFGAQLKMVDKLPIRLGYTYSQVPIQEGLEFFSVPATAITENGVQLGLGYEFNDQFVLNAVYHAGFSSGATEGFMLNPMMAGPGNPLGAVPGTSVSYEMTTSMFMMGFNWKL